MSWCLQETNTSPFGNMGLKCSKPLKKCNWGFCKTLEPIPEESEYDTQRVSFRDVSENVSQEDSFDSSLDAGEEIIYEEVGDGQGSMIEVDVPEIIFHAFDIGSSSAPSGSFDKSSTASKPKSISFSGKKVKESDESPTLPGSSGIPPDYSRSDADLQMADDIFICKF